MTDKESIRHFETQQKRYKREHDGNECPHYTNAISAMRERIERNSHTSEFDRYLAEQMKDPKFKREWEMQQRGWISVEDRLPEIGSDVLAFQDNRDEARIVPANYDKGVWYDCVFNVEAENITHWMPLPEPPKEDK